MNDVLTSYLLQHKSIIIPEVGSIYIQNKAAITDFVNKQLFPASFSYRYDRYNDVPDPGFYQYLALKKGVSEEDAIAWFGHFSDNIRTKIKTEGYFEWDGIGVFKKDSSGDVIFEEQHKFLPILPPVPAKRVIRKDARHAILVGDSEKTNFQMSEMLQEPPLATKKERWRIYAVLLFAIGLIILAFHFYSTGFRWGAAGNQEKVNVKSVGD